MSKFIIPIINLLLCSYLILAYIVCWVEFETWHDKTIAFGIITISVYIISLVMNKLLPGKISFFGGILDVLSGPLMIIGAFACIALLEPMAYETYWLIHMGRSDVASTFFCKYR
ncbi:Uncharacterised protein [Enterobacter cancerogenus]|uniref:Uncharacterized protein n=1 Tax=Enterobacter cancerogenus TaxID=69218 RepID=A0A484Z8I0_9ENTR|nr:Uncharacterised protein [Enterobacter cancerogenus]